MTISKTIGGKKYSGTIQEVNDRFHWTRGGLDINDKDRVRSVGVTTVRSSCCSLNKDCKGFDTAADAEADFEKFCS